MKTEIKMNNKIANERHCKMLQKKMQIKTFK